MTAPYSVGDVVEVRWPGRNRVDGEVVQLHPKGIGARVRYEGRSRWFADIDISPPRDRRSLKLATPEVSEEADSWESARERSTGSVRAELHAVPKAPKPKRSASHLDYVRSLPCCVSGSRENIEAHHVENAGMGRKCSDLLTVPLTAELHAYWHAHGHLPGMDRLGSLAVFWESIGRGLAMKMEAGR